MANKGGKPKSRYRKAFNGCGCWYCSPDNAKAFDKTRDRTRLKQKLKHSDKSSV